MVHLHPHKLNENKINSSLIKWQIYTSFLYGSLRHFRSIQRIERAQRYENTNASDTTLPFQGSFARIFSVQYLNVSYIARGCPFHIRIGESSQNNKYTVTSDIGFIAATFILCLHRRNIETSR